MVSRGRVPSLDGTATMLVVESLSWFYFLSFFNSVGRLSWVPPYLNPEWWRKGGHNRCQSIARERDGWRGFQGCWKHFETRPVKPDDQKGTIEGRSRNLNSHAPSPGCSLHASQWRTAQTLRESLFRTPRLCIEEFSTVYIFIQMKVFLYFDNRKQWPIFRVIKSGTNKTAPFSHHCPVTIKTPWGNTPLFTVETHTPLKFRLIRRLRSLENEIWLLCDGIWLST